MVKRLVSNKIMETNRLLKLYLSERSFKGWFFTYTIIKYRESVVIVK